MDSVARGVANTAKSTPRKSSSMLCNKEQIHCCFINLGNNVVYVYLRLLRHLIYGIAFSDLISY